MCGLLCGLQALDERTIGHNPERLCLLKGGIVYSNAVTTVSPNYAHETLQGGQGGAADGPAPMPCMGDASPGVACALSGHEHAPTSCLLCSFPVAAH